MNLIAKKIKDIGTVVGGSTPSTKDESNYGGDISWITPKDMTTLSSRFINQGERNITEKGFKSCSTIMLPINSVLFSSRAPIGYVAINNINEVCTNQGFKSIIPNEEIDYMYLYYALKYNKKNIESFGSGSTFKEVSGNVMKEIEIMIPDNKKDQLKISKILSVLDDKIELNNQINNNLYDICRTIYNERFSNKTDSLVKLDSISIITSGKRPLNKDVGSIPLIGASGEMGFTDNYNIDEKVLITGRVGTLGIIKRYNYKIWASDNTLIINSKYINYIEQYLNTIDFNNLNRGSTQPLLTQTDLKNMELYFDEEEVSKYCNEIETFKKTIEENVMQNKTLEQLRDTLLPKLMNGEIDLDNIEI